MLYKKILFVVFFSVIMTLPIHARQTLILSTPGLPPFHYPDQTGSLDLLLKEAFDRINVDVSLNYYPPEEALIKANNGETDGDAVRIGGLGSLYPNLLQVPAIALQTDFVAFTKDPKIGLAGWQDLKSYNIAIVEGHKISEKMVTRTQSLSRAKNVESLFKLLKNDQVDIAICEQTFGFEMARKLNMKDAIAINPPLAKLLFYIYLHKKHEILIPGLIKAINDMHLDGTYNKIMNNPK
ncbi:MAG: amino acid ABC transporter substrate-binding protein [Desulfobacula sp.]|nr:amino acid ABC transporter substrate-binding protein [Desulfobacula sp.]